MNFPFLCTTPLFHGTDPEEAEAMLRCMGAYTRRYGRQETVYHMGETVQNLGLILSGGANIEADDAWGNRSILSHVGAGQIFAETYACLPQQSMMVSAVASQETVLLSLNAAALLTHSCPSRDLILTNLLRITAEKNLALSRRIFYTSSKTIRGRLLSYLSDQAVLQGSLTFSIPFDRQQLADYLGVDRSALSNELSKLRREGLLTTRKNRFSLLTQADLP